MASNSRAPCTRVPEGPPLALQRRRTINRPSSLRMSRQADTTARVRIVGSAPPLPPIRTQRDATREGGSPQNGGQPAGNLDFGFSVIASGHRHGIYQVPQSLSIVANVPCACERDCPVSGG